MMLHNHISNSLMIYCKHLHKMCVFEPNYDKSKRRKSRLLNISIVTFFIPFQTHGCHSRIQQTERISSYN